MGKYFDRFPSINYDGNIAKNLLSKVDFTETSKKNINSSFDFTVTEAAARPDLLAEAAYKNPHYDWLIYLANGMLDPYYDYCLSNSNLDLFIESKYGSTVDAMKKILYYRNNWAPDTSTISEDIYNGLSNNIQKYYKPVINNFNQVIGYERRTDDWVVSTNKIIDLTVTDASIFEIDERITQSNTNAKGTVIGIDTENNIIRLQHIEGAFEIDDDVLSIDLIQQVIPDEESAFWAPVNAYDMELEKNEYNKHISLIKASYLSDVDKSFQEQINK